MSFEQLVHTTSICRDEFKHFEFVDEWKNKRELLKLYLIDLPNLENDYFNSNKVPYESNPKITIVDSIPSLRLSAMCEGASNCLYSMSEIASLFANKVSEKYPKNFNKLRKKIEKGAYTELNIEEYLFDLSWYKKIREIRTELTHYSTLFLGEESNNVLLVVNTYRNLSDKEMFKQKAMLTLKEFIECVNNAMIVLDNFASYLLSKHILKSLDLNKKIFSIKKDDNGWPIFTNDNRLIPYETTVEDHLKKCGIYRIN